MTWDSQKGWFVMFQRGFLQLMEILQPPGILKKTDCKWWDKQPTLTGDRRISSNTSYEKPTETVQILLQQLGVRRYPMFIITPGGGFVG